MATVRQMPELYLRGGLANVTMRNLTDDNKVFCNVITEWVTNNPRMKKHKNQVIRKLGETIGADYRQDRNAAEQEYNIAIWKGVVNLFFHKYYQFKCQICGSTDKPIKSKGTYKPIDQLTTSCPNCGMTKNKNTQQYVEYNKDYEEQYESPIIAYPYKDIDNATLEHELHNGIITKEQYERQLQFFRYDNPSAIINDEVQLVKFFGEFVWGYFRQHLRENQREEHNKKPTQVFGRADEIIVKEIVSACEKLKLDHFYCDTARPEDGWWTINVNTNYTPPEFTGELLPILDKASKLDIVVTISDSNIKIKETCSAPSIETTILESERVTMMMDDNKNSDDEAGFTIQNMAFKTVRGEKVMLDNDIEKVDQKELIETIYSNLPDGDCKKIFQLFTESGDIYNEFHSRFNYSGEPRQVHIANFLGITTRIVKQHLHNIKLVCLANGCTPS